MKPTKLLLFLLMSGNCHADWVRFRGDNGAGVDTSATIPVEWNAENQLFKTKLPGVGHGSPVVFGQRVFLLAADEKTFDRIPVCVDATSGEILWQDKIGTGKFKGHRFNSPASSTPTVDATHVYFSWGTADQLSVAAYTHKGKPAWSSDLGPVPGGHGFAASPSVVGDLVLLNKDQESGGGSLLALDSATGKAKWSVPRKSIRLSYSTPCTITVDGRKFLIFTNWQHGFTVIDPKDGKVVSELSTFDLEVKERAISSPIVWKDLVIGTCGFTTNPKHCVAVRVAKDGTLTEVWRIEKAVPHIPSPIIVDDLLYLWDDKGILTCIDPATGDIHYEERVPTRGKTFGSPVSDGKSIFCADEEGNIHAVATGKTFNFLNSNALKELCRSTPALSHGNLYLRTSGHLIAIKGKQP
jgi:outer membrane protein assembly factor BamB